jgi:hypothetical protein
MDICGQNWESRGYRKDDVRCWTWLLGDGRDAENQIVVGKSGKLVVHKQIARAHGRGAE